MNTEVRKSRAYVAEVRSGSAPISTAKVSIVLTDKDPSLTGLRTATLLYLYIFYIALAYGVQLDLHLTLSLHPLTYIPFNLRLVQPLQLPIITRDSTLTTPNLITLQFRLFLRGHSLRIHKHGKM